MSYEFTMNDQNKIIFGNALAETKRLLDAAHENYHNHQVFAAEDSSGEDTLDNSLKFFKDLYDWLYLLQNQDSISLTTKNFLDFKKDYSGYHNHIDIFLDSFEEMTIIATLKSPKNLAQQAMLTFHYNSQTNKNENQQVKENSLDSTISPINKFNLK